MVYLHPKSIRFKKLIRAVTGPLGALIIALCVTTLCGMFVDPRGLALAVGVAAILLLGILYPLIAVHALSGTICFHTSRQEESETVQIKARLRNRSLLPVWGVSIEGIVVGDTDLPYEGWVDSLINVPRGETSFSWEVKGLLRGQYPQQSPNLSCGFPFGLIHARQTLHCRGELLIWPRRVSPPDLSSIPHSGKQEGLTESNRSGYDGDLMGTRDFRQGDSLRRIHWVQSARHERLIVVERHSLCSPCIHLMLDLIGAQAGKDSSREKAIRMANSLIEKWDRQGAEVILTICDREERRYVGTLRTHRDALARLPQTEALLSPATDSQKPGDDIASNYFKKAGENSISVTITTLSSPLRFRSTFTLTADAMDVEFACDEMELSLKGKRSPLSWQHGFSRRLTPKIITKEQGA